MFAYCRNNPVCRKDISGMVDMNCLEEADDDFDVTPGDDDLGYCTVGEVSYSFYAPDASNSTFANYNNSNYSNTTNPYSASTTTHVDNSFTNIAYTPKVMSQMSNPSDLYHAFPSIIDSMVPFESSTTLIGGDSRARAYVSFPGSVNGIGGVYEYIFESDGLCNHRLFRPF